LTGYVDFWLSVGRNKEVADRAPGTSYEFYWRAKYTYSESGPLSSDVQGYQYSPSAEAGCVRASCDSKGYYIYSGTRNKTEAYAQIP